MKRGNVVLGGIFLLIGVILMKVALEPHEMLFADPKALNVMTYPRILIGMWLVASFLYAVSKKDDNDWYDFRKAKWQLLKALACIAAYAFLFSWLGLFLSTFLFLVAFFWILDYRNPKIALPIALACSGGAYVIFEVFLGIPMPRPFFL